MAVEKVKYSIERFGFLFPIVADINFVIVCGHIRVRACRELGIQTVPCIIADELTEEQINLFRLIDNKTSEYSDWDFEKLKNELSLVDLTLDKNQFLLEQFELSAEIFDLNPEQAEIKIPTFNFMRNDKNRKLPVSTISIVSNENLTSKIDDEIDFASEVKPDTDDYIKKSINQTEQTLSDISLNIKAESDNSIQNDGTVNINDTTICLKKFDKNNIVSNVIESKVTNKELAPTLIQFRFGDIAFFISQIELDKLNKKYGAYIDSGKALQESFVSYLLEGVEQCD